MSDRPADPDNLVLEMLRGIRADITTMRRETHEVKLQLREHATWLGKLDHGQGLILQMLQRTDERLTHTEARLELRDAP